MVRYYQGQELALTASLAAGLWVQDLGSPRRCGGSPSMVQISLEDQGLFTVASGAQSCSLAHGRGSLRLDEWTPPNTHKQIFPLSTLMT